MRTSIVLTLLLAACTPPPPSPPPTCDEATTRRCAGGLLVTCDGTRDCGAEGLVCDLALGCVTCIPDALACAGHDVARCDETGAWTTGERCDLAAGLGCIDGACADLCEAAAATRGTRGCELFAADLDNVAPSLTEPPHDWGLVVVDPWPVPVEIVVERDVAAPGAPHDVVEVARVVVPPYDAETIALPVMALDGSATGAPTHTALTRGGFRVRATLPIGAFQLSPLAGGSFSAEGSRLLPLGTLGTQYTVLDWPQTIAHGSEPPLDFDPNRDDEDFRTFLTIVATADDTHVSIDLGPLGPNDAAVVGGGPVAELGPGGSLEIDLDALDVLNLETRGLGSSFTGSRVESSAPVAVFVGSEASDVPVFESYPFRSCCADHLEEALVPDALAGSAYVVVREPSRSAAVSRGSGPDGPIAETTPPSFVRVVALEDGAVVSLTGEMPVTLGPGESAFFPIERSALLSADHPVHVLVAHPGGQLAGLPLDVATGDPSMALVPPVGTFRTEHVVASPGSFDFDFVSITAPSDASVRLDGEPVETRLGPDGEPACEREEVDATWVVHHCQLSFPVVVPSPDRRTEPGDQDDGAHVVEASAPVGVVVSGFSGYAGYSYPGEALFSVSAP